MLNQIQAQEFREKFVCSNCIKEEFLGSTLFKEAGPQVCGFCGLLENAAPMKKICDAVTEALDTHYQAASGGEKDGNKIERIIRDILKTNDKLAGAITNLIEYKRANQIARKNKGNSDSLKPLSSGMSLERKSIGDATYGFSLYDIEWNSFEKNIQTKSRFLGKKSLAVLEEVFGDLTSLTHGGQKVLVQAGPNQHLNRIYRARVFQSADRLNEAIKHPEREISSPPSNLAIAGRMNAQGISVFYGAKDEQVAISEVRAPVGSRVVVGEFEISRELTLIDIDAFRRIDVAGSVFDPEYLKRLNHASFLDRLSQRICKPVMPTDEAMDYLITQVIAEYLSELTMPNIDGVIFSSAQAKQEGANIVLFGKAAYCENQSSDWLAKMKVIDETRLGQAYIVEQEKVALPRSEELPVIFPYVGGIMKLREETALRLKSICVHHIVGVKYSTIRYTAVRRIVDKVKEEMTIEKILKGGYPFD